MNELVTNEVFDVAIVGGGPAGLAVAIECALRGSSAVVFERRSGPLDKACGEGLLPAGLASLERLGVLPYLERTGSASFESITYFQEDGRFVAAKLPAPGGLGIRRLALTQSMTARAKALGVVIHEGRGVRSHERHADSVVVTSDTGPVRAKLLVAADGLHSPLRKQEGLEVPYAGPKRFGLRRHVAMKPWAPAVEVHFTPGAEAYVTPTGANRVGIAFLWEDGRLQGPVSFERLLAKFPLLEKKIAGQPFDSEARGAGPLRQPVKARVKDRFVLVGDAAGYVDAITGEGLSLAFDQAEVLGHILPAVLKAGATASSLLPYEKAASQAFARYERLASTLVWAARHPRLRRFIINRLIEMPALFELALRASVTGQGSRLLTVARPRLTQR